ncbi:MAG: DUF2207 domain-containing protein [Clostridia bacterium]|nr:DUF2207 domain-containing protein [Clostridia bacterium]
MKKIKAPFICLIALFAAVIAAVLCGIGGGITASAATDPDYLFEVKKYDVTYDIQSNCAISVTEDITVSYKGRLSTGFLRDIPANGGVQIRNVYVQKFGEKNRLEAVYFDVMYEDINYVTVDIGDSRYKVGKSESYRITYDYNISSSVVKDGMLPLNPIGFGWECDLYDCNVTLILPDGYKSATCYKGLVGSTKKCDFEESVVDGRTVLTAYTEHLKDCEGITFNINFEDGAISSYFDFTPYWFVLAAVAVLVILVVVKFLGFNKSTLTPVVNFEAPENIDPLMMGKLIDNRVDKEDITSMIYYFADKGYLKINLDDNADPTLIRIIQTLPEEAPEYEKVMFYNLFRDGETVKPSQLANRFYRTVDKVTSIVNSQTKGLYTSVSMTISVIFALIGGLLLSAAPVVLAFLGISHKLLMFAPFLALVPAFFVYVICQSTVYNKLKFTKKNKLILWLVVAVLCIILTVCYVFFVPTSILGYLPKALLCVVCSAIIVLSVSVITRTDDYTEKLNQIIGFKQFILLAEKDKLEAMLEDDPQFYYHVLPYAQVLGVSDKWEEKFRDLTVEPPQWATTSMLDTVIQFHVLNNIIRRSTVKMTNGLVSRPSSSGINGGGRGIGGGFSGGGFGGGGGRGR